MHMNAVLLQLSLDCMAKIRNRKWELEKLEILVTFFSIFKGFSIYLANKNEHNVL